MEKAIVGNNYEISEQKFQYCVYKHRINNKVFYVGFGDLERPFKYGRNEKWKEIVETNNGSFIIDIIHYTNSREEGLLLERKLQDAYWELGMCEANISRTNEWKEKFVSQQKGIKRGKSPHCANRAPKRGSQNGHAKTVKIIDIIENTETVFGAISEAVDFLSDYEATYKKIYSRIQNGKLFVNRFKIMEVN